MSSSSSVDAPVLLRVGGVPEHFSLPWHMAEERGLFAAHGVRVQWVSMPLGTGAMVSALAAGELDCIVALTEGVVSAIAQGAKSKIVGTYVESPLRWAISTGGGKAASTEAAAHDDGSAASGASESAATPAAASAASAAASSPSPRLESVSDLRGRRVGISRFGSGSHLMSCVLASQRGWQQSELDYVVAGDFAALRAGVNAAPAARFDAFMWERGMTAPYYASGELRCVGEITTPWPCFVMAASDAALAQPGKRDAISRARVAVQQACALFHSPAEEAHALQQVSRRFGLADADARDWYGAVRISAAATVARDTIRAPLHALKEAHILNANTYASDMPLERFVDGQLAQLR